MCKCWELFAVDIHVCERGYCFFFLEQDCFVLNSGCRFGKVGYAYYMGPRKPSASSMYGFVKVDLEST